MNSCETSRGEDTSWALTFRRGRGPARPFRAEGPQAKDNLEAMTFTARLGHIIEHKVLDIWDGTTAPTTEQKQELQIALTNLNLCLKPLKKRTLTEREIAEVFNPIVKSRSILDQEPGTPENQDLRKLFQLVDETTGTTFLDLYKESPQFEDIPQYGHYLAQAAMMIGKELCQPNFNKGDSSLLRDVTGPDFQFDAIMLPQPVAQLPSYEALIATGVPVPYEILEIKAVFRASLTSGPNKLGKLPREILRYYTKELGEAILWRLNENEKVFPLPRAINIYCLRGPLPSRHFHIEINWSFLERWATDLETTAKRLELERENETAVEQYVNIIGLLPVIRNWQRRVERKEQEEQEARHQRYESVLTSFGPITKEQVEKVELFARPTKQLKRKKGNESQKTPPDKQEQPLTQGILFQV